MRRVLYTSLLMLIHTISLAAIPVREWADSLLHLHDKRRAVLPTDYKEWGPGKWCRYGPGYRPERHKTYMSPTDWTMPERVFDPSLKRYLPKTPRTVTYNYRTDGTIAFGKVYGIKEDLQVFSKYPHATQLSRLVEPVPFSQHAPINTGHKS
jgi:hypothetical protein